MTVLVHATAVVIGTTGVILVGPSGAGKSSLALRLVSAARRSGHFAAFLSDDQVFVDAVNGRLVATGPETIKGKIELRGSGIGHVETVDSAILHLALSPVAVDSSNRIPEENQSWSPIEGLHLPHYPIDRGVVDPFGWLVALVPGFPITAASQL